LSYRIDPLGGPSFLRLRAIDGAPVSDWLLGEDSRFVGFVVPPGATDTIEGVVDMDGNGVLDSNDAVVVYHPGAHTTAITPYRAKVGSRLHPFAQIASLQAIPESDGDIALLWSSEDFTDPPVNVYRSTSGGVWELVAGGVTGHAYTDIAPAPSIYFYYLAVVGAGGVEEAASNVASTTTL